MPVYGNAYPYVWQVHPGGGGGWSPDEGFVIGIADNVKTWALLENHQITATRAQAAGYIMALEL